MKIGFIGLGIMGRPMAKNLLRAGHALTVCDHHPEHVAEPRRVRARRIRCGRPAGNSW
ncbi:MAG: NAD(P)-binding domain-containing protein [Anaerotruncus massiliensis (ex Togo et al. 2019)]